MAYFPNKIGFGENDISVDANSRLRVDTYETIFESKYDFRVPTLTHFTESSGVGSTVTHIPGIKAIQLAITTASGSYSLMQTKQHFPIPLAKSLQAVETFILRAATAGVTKRVGVFEDSMGGVFLEQSGVDGLMYIVRRQNNGTGIVEMERIVQTSWNIDTLDGNGKTGYTIDWTKIQALIIDFLNPAGQIRFGFRINGLVRYAHAMPIGNTRNITMFQTTSIPLRAEIINEAVSAGTNFQITGWSMNVEGRIDSPNTHFSTGSGITSFAVTTRRPICSIQPRTSINGVINRGQIVIKDVNLGVGTNSCYWELVYSGSLTGASFGVVDGTYSITNFDTAATAISGGITIASGYAGASSGTDKVPVNIDIFDRLPICVFDRQGLAAVSISLVATSLTGTSNVAGSIGWEEIR